MLIHFYTKDHCTLCDKALEQLKILEGEYPHQIERRDITSNVEWLRKYRVDIPVLEINGEELRAEDLTFESLEAFLAKHA